MLLKRPISEKCDVHLSALSPARTPTHKFVNSRSRGRCPPRQGDDRPRALRGYLSRHSRSWRLAAMQLTERPVMRG
jgi:hypothetical protein